MELSARVSFSKRIQNGFLICVDIPVGSNK